MHPHEPSDEPVAAPGNGLDVLRVMSIIFQRFTEPGDCSTQAGVADVRIFPKRIEQFITTDQPLPIAEEVDEEREDGGFEVDRSSLAQQLSRVQINAEGSECVHR